MSENGTSHTPQELMLISRFISTFSGAFRAFFIYSKDNKAIDEIINNVAKRFQLVAGTLPELRLGITNLSFTYEGNPVGFKDVTTHLTTALRNLGFKEIIFRAPIHGRNFFPILNILSRRDSKNAQLDKLSPFHEDGEVKPISLVPRISQSSILLLNDEMIQRRLAPLNEVTLKCGLKFTEGMEQSHIETLPDLYSWVLQQTEDFPGALKDFVNNFIMACRDGFFPLERLLKNLPLTNALQNKLMTAVAAQNTPPQRRAAPLGHRYLSVNNKQMDTPADWVTRISSFSDPEVKWHLDVGIWTEQNSAFQELQLVTAFMEESGPTSTMGLRLLTRILSKHNPAPVQEAALKWGVKAWIQNQKNIDDPQILSLLSSLRENLCAPQNMSFVLYPLRKLDINDPILKKLSQFIFSLGEAAFPALIQSLEAEENKDVRLKLCHVITLIAKERGIDFLIEQLPKASKFLLRNLIMILGDIKSLEAVNAIGSCIQHAEKIVRVEAIQSLIKISDDNALKALLDAIQTNANEDSKIMIVKFFTKNKYPPALPPLIRLANAEDNSLDLKMNSYQTIGAIGGPAARHFFESVINQKSLLGRFSEDQKQLQIFAKSLLSRIPQ